MTAALSFMNALGEGRKILPAVPLFHVNAWGLPYSCPLVGASLVMPGPGLDGDSLFELMDAESVYSMWGVPTVFQGLLATMQEKGRAPNGLCDAVIGGSAVTQSLIDAYRENGVEVCHAWGMTELSPLGTQGNLPAGMESSPKQERDAFKLAQGRRLFSVQMKLVDDNGATVAHDGASPGELYVRGNSTISQYYKNDEATASAIDADGWFGTGDVATLDARGCLTITDRAKDLIKSGGEWISSLDIENIAMSHPSVLQCAVIAIPHPKWDERPLLVVVKASDAVLDKQSILDLIAEKMSSWQVPDDVVVRETLPLAPTGKISKKDLREMYADYISPK
jgi:fatty-acyl-CoA synthase